MIVTIGLLIVAAVAYGASLYVAIVMIPDALNHEAGSGIVAFFGAYWVMLMVLGTWCLALAV
jgi:hypothetical protein